MSVDCKHRSLAKWQKMKAQQFEILAVVEVETGCSSNCGDGGDGVGEE